MLDDGGRRLTRGALWRESGRLGDELAENGVEAGDVVLVFMPNRAEWLLAMLAALRLGAVPANLAIRTDEDTLAYAAERCGARALLTVDRHGRADPGELARAAAARCTTTAAPSAPSYRGRQPDADHRSPRHEGGEPRTDRGFVPPAGPTEPCIGVPVGQFGAEKSTQEVNEGLRILILGKNGLW